MLTFNPFALPNYVEMLQHTARVKKHRTMRSREQHPPNTNILL